MSNITLAIPDDLLAKARSYAQRHGTTLNAMLREILERRLASADESLSTDAWIARVRALSRPGQDRPAWTWNRDELYADRLDRHRADEHLGSRVAEPRSDYRP